MPLRVMNINTEGALQRVVQGEAIGTLVTRWKVMIDDIKRMPQTPNGKRASNRSAIEIQSSDGPGPCQACSITRRFPIMVRTCRSSRWPTSVSRFAHHHCAAIRTADGEGG